MLTYSSFRRCPNSLARISCWGVADKGTLTFVFSSQISFSPWPVMILYDFCRLYAQARQVVWCHCCFCAVALAVVWPGCRCSQCSTQHLPISCFIGVLPWIYSCSIYDDLLHIHHSFKASSVVLSGAFIHSCCHLHCMHNSVVLPLT